VPEGAEAGIIRAGLEHVYAVAFSPDGRWLATGSREKSALGTFWKQLTGNRLKGGRSPTVHVWKAADRSLQLALAENDDDVHGVAFSPDGRSLAAGSDEGALRVWQLEPLAGAGSRP